MITVVDVGEDAELWRQCGEAGASLEVPTSQDAIRALGLGLMVVLLEGQAQLKQVLLPVLKILSQVSTLMSRG